MSSILAFEFFFAVIIIVLQADVFLRPHLQAHCNKSNALVLPGRSWSWGLATLGSADMKTVVAVVGVVFLVFLSQECYAGERLNRVEPEAPTQPCIVVIVA